MKNLIYILGLLLMAGCSKEQVAVSQGVTVYTITADFDFDVNKKSLIVNGIDWGDGTFNVESNEGLAISGEAMNVMSGYYNGKYYPIYTEKKVRIRIEKNGIFELEQTRKGSFSFNYK